ncbi:alpha/beta hydrolase [Pseudomonas sp. RIT-PI-AD]|uniref:alpha/beta fold hydrolase n=1 Tax=Pseudomonas sp. RIT-PI-AD TaxID=3035294 RepID=UPI0021D9FA80|nr:alpha/beta hydrolase [Pseudomonas sp. RIT-PI-AD]
MGAHTAVVDIDGHKLYTEFHHHPQASKTIVLVNGSLSTTASFAQTLRYLHPQFNVLLYDAPYAGRSKPHNPPGAYLGKETEAEILLGLIERFQADHLMSFSWGGVASLMAVARRPACLEKAVIGSFSPLINAAMLDYLQRGLEHLQRCDRENVAGLVNTTIGKHLPALFKRHNHRHISNLDTHEYAQMHQHIRQVLSLDAMGYTRTFAAIDIPLLFINGERDEYAPPEDARQFAGLIGQSTFATVRNAGHFLDLEHKLACLETRDAVLGFLRTPAPLARRHPPRPPFWQNRPRESLLHTGT